MPEPRSSSELGSSSEPPTPTPPSDGDLHAESDLLWSIAQAVEAETGDGFFRSLVRALAETLDVDYAFVSELTRGGTHFRTLAFQAHGAPGEDFELPLAGTPCEEVLRGVPAFHAEGLQRRFPADVGLAAWHAESYGGVPLLDRDGCVRGHLALLHRSPISDGRRVLGVMRLFAVRAVAEIERQRVASALRASEERLAGILDSATDAILSFDDRDRIQYANPAAARMLRCEVASLIGSSITRFTTPAGLTRLRAAAAAESGSDPYVGEGEGLLARRADGSEFSFEASLSRSGPGGPPLFTVILRDVEARRAAERRVRDLRRQAEYLREELRAVHNFEEIVGRSPALVRVLEQIDRVAPTDTTVLIQGETGTGKELVARALHARSRRSDRPLVKLSCAAMAPGLLESELFGHERGAFTGATQRRIGRFELADGGTLFLDEVAELPIELQAKLLRVLQEQEFERVGSSRTIRVSVRLIAATNRDLAREVAAGGFRDDLRYRLAVFPVELPPLRERVGDLPLLVEYLVARHAPRLGRRIDTIDPEALHRLARYPWPGNVRELENVIERALILGQGEVFRVSAEVLPEPFEVEGWRTVRSDSADLAPEGATAGAPEEVAASAPVGRTSLAEVERRHILDVLEATRWRIEGPQGAAVRLGVHPSTLRSRLARLGLQRGDRPPA